MELYIKDMEMPKSCRKCMISQPDGCGWVCPIIESKPIVDGRVNSRHPHCPLIFVPPHGRLGDLDKLVEKIDGIWDCNDMVFKPDDHCCNIPEDCKGCKWAQTKDCIQRMVENAPTIIPASGTEE